MPYVAMSRSAIRLIVLAVSYLAIGCEREANESGKAANSKPQMEATMNTDLAEVDAYLVKWDQFARGAISLRLISRSQNRV